MPHDSAISIGERLKKARESLGLTLKEVAKKMGFSNYQTLSNVESGKREVKAWELAQLARIYYRDIDHFLQEKTATEPAYVLWRKKKDPSKTRLHERRFIRYCQNYRQIEELLQTANVHEFKPIQCNKEDFFSFGFVDRLTSDYYTLLELGARPACSFYKVLDERFGIKILFLGMGREGSGASTISDFGPAILINADDAPWRRNFDLAHEFFHIVTWNIFDPREIYDSPEKGKSKVEVWADIFASTLLLPEKEVREGFQERARNGKISYFDCVALAHEFDVSIDALLWRLASLRLLRREEVEKVLKNADLRELYWQQTSTERQDVLKFPTRYVNMAFRGMQLGLISRGIFAQYMEIDRQEIPEFLATYGLDENGDYNIELAAT